jgi:Rod binding domain-containing protein
MTDDYIKPIDYRATISSALSKATEGKQLQAFDLQGPSGHSANDVDAVLNSFQSIFMGEMMKAMRQSVPESGLIEDEGGAREMYQGLLDQEYVSAASDQMGALGLTEALKQQLGLDTVSGTAETVMAQLALPPAEKVMREPA